jgi:hypothetical protein
MILIRLDDVEIRESLTQTAIKIEKALHFVRTLADGFMPLPKALGARAQLTDSGFTIQATLAYQLDAMRLALQSCDDAFLPEIAEIN